jgi:hypothetical protein
MSYLQPPCALSRAARRVKGGIERVFACFAGKKRAERVSLSGKHKKARMRAFHHLNGEQFPEHAVLTRPLDCVYSTLLETADALTTPRRLL